MRFKVETITPDRARKMLDTTERLGLTNRTIRPARVAKLAHAITNGQWLVTHQGIALRDDGAVLDGQHRLMAIVAADQAVDMIVTRDAAEETFSVIDTGAARSTGDSLKIAGFTDVNHLAAEVRGYLVYSQLIGTTGNYRTSMGEITTADVLDFLSERDNRDTAVGAVNLARGVASGLARHGLATAIGMSVLTVRLHPNELGSDTTTEFYLRLTDGVALEADSPILALRRWFMSDTGYARISNEARRAVACSVILKCLNDYALRKPRSIVAFRLGSEPFPAPLPKGSRKAWEEELARKEAAV